MRFAAVQIPAKIGVRSLNGEKLDVLNTFRTSSDSSPFFTLSPLDFFTPSFARRRWTDSALHLSRVSEKRNLSNP